MRCSTCPGDRQDLCRREGCYAKLCEMRHATVVVDDRAAAALRAAAAGLSSLPPLMLSHEPVALADLDLQVKRLDVESGDILVVRTAKKLTAAQADAIDAQVSQLARRHGVRDVSVVVLDNATDLTVERPGPIDTRMQHQATRAAPIVSR